VPDFGPCWLVRPSAKNAQLPIRIAMMACGNESPIEMMTAPLTM